MYRTADVMPILYKKTFETQGLSCAKIYCAIVNLQEKEAKLMAIVNSLTLPPNTPRAIVEMYNKYTTDKERRAFLIVHLSDEKLKKRLAELQLSWDQRVLTVTHELDDLKAFSRVSDEISEAEISSYLEHYISLHLTDFKRNLDRRAQAQGIKEAEAAARQEKAKKAIPNDLDSLQKLIKSMVSKACNKGKPSPKGKPKGKPQGKGKGKSPKSEPIILTSRTRKNQGQKSREKQLLYLHGKTLSQFTAIVGWQTPQQKEKLKPLDNKSYHDLSKGMTPNHLETLLTQGLKFIPLQPRMLIKDFKPNYDRFLNRIRWHYFFENSPPNTRSESLIPRGPVPYSAAMYSILEDKLTILTKGIAKADKIPSVSRNPIPLKELANLRVSHPEVIYIAADKNLGLVKMDTLNYHRLVMEHLDDATTYQVVADSDFEVDFFIANIIQLCTTELRNTNHTYLADLLLIGNFKFPKFHVLPKLHKSPIKGRPIVGNVNWVSTNTSIYLSRLMDQSIQRLCPHTIQSSIQVIDSIQVIPFNPLTDYLVTLDVSSLYTNIEVDRLVNILQSIDPLWATLGKLIFKSNYFTYLDKTYWQCQGIAMGTNSAVHLANLYLARLVDPIVVSFPNVIYYKRYIDDLLLIFRGTQHELLSFEKRLHEINHMIKFTREVSNLSINFLDLHIYYLKGKLEINTYFKGISKFAYIPPHSTHPRSVLKGMIIGELTRYYRTNSMENTFILTLELFKDRLFKRGYKLRYINDIFITFILKLGQLYINKFHPIREHKWLTLAKQFISNPSDFTSKRPRLLGIINLPIIYDGDHISQYIYNFIKEVDTILPLHFSRLRPTYIMAPSVGRLILRSSLSKEQIEYIKNNYNS